MKEKYANTLTCTHMYKRKSSSGKNSKLFFKLEMFNFFLFNSLDIPDKKNLS